MRSPRPAVVVLLLSFLLAAAPARAATIGQLAPGTAEPVCNASPFDFFLPTPSSGQSYEVPPFGARITSWSHNAAPGNGQLLSFKVFRQVAGDEYRVVAHDGPHALTPGTVNTFAVDLAVSPGDLIGLNDVNASMTTPNACIVVGTMDQILAREGDLPDGDSGTFAPSDPGRPNVTAVVKPSNSFTLGAITRNRKKGTAILSVTVPGPGTLALTGKGVKGVAATSGAHASLSVGGPGTASLTIRPKKRARAKLNDTGKAKVKAGVTYTPTDGDPSTQTRKVKLRKLL